MPAWRCTRTFCVPVARSRLPQPSRTRAANPLGSSRGRGPRPALSRGESLPQAASGRRCPPGAQRVPLGPPQPPRVLSHPGKPYMLFVPLPAPPWPPSSRVFCAFPERHVGGPRLVWSRPSSAALLPGLGLPGNPAFRCSSPFTHLFGTRPCYLKMTVLTRVPVPCCVFNFLSNK